MNQLNQLIESDASQPAEDEQLVAEASDPSHLPSAVDAAAIDTECMKDLGLQQMRDLEGGPSQ